MIFVMISFATDAPLHNQEIITVSSTSESKFINKVIYSVKIAVTII